MCDAWAQKRALREKYKTLRESVKSHEKDEAIARRVLSLFENFENADSFFVYLSFGTEVDTKKLVEELLARGKSVRVPRILGSSMIAVPFGGGMIKNKFGILEPAGGEDKPCAVAIAPLLCCDTKGNRLGYGGGYYDRYFALHKETLRVGILYGACVSPVTLPMAEGDIPLDMAVTEEEVISFPRAGEWARNG